MANGDLLVGALVAISKHVRHCVDVEADPDRFVKELYKQWKADGGKSNGKPRHSDRFLENNLREHGATVRSLTPKLSGKTKIQPKDASALVCTFLLKWPTPSTTDGEMVYKPFLTDKEINAVAAHVEGLIGNGEAPAPAAPRQEPLQSLPGEDIGILIARLFEEADALITVSPTHTLITQPKTELIGFRNLMNALWAVERRDKRARPLIWVLDLGEQRFDDLDARRKYLNVQALIGRFKALKRFEERGFEKRWEWLQARAAIVLLDTVSSFEDSPVSTGGRGRASHPHFVPHNVTLSAVATDWLPSNELRALYGRDLDQLHQRSFSVFFNAHSDWTSEAKWPETSDLRYFGYASFADKGETVGRGVELPPLSHRYAEGFRATAMAAAHALGLTYQIPEYPLPEEAISGAEANDQLHYFGFHILRLDDFLANY